MTVVDPEQLKRGACLDLPLAVVDKYFAANQHTEYFQFLTAKAICGKCAVRAACLVDAIQMPSPASSVRGGESAPAIERLHRRYVSGEASAEALAADALLRQRGSRTASDSPTLRAGRFADAPLIEN